MSEIYKFENKYFESLQKTPRSTQPKTISLVQWLASKKELASLSYVLKRGTSYRGYVTKNIREASPGKCFKLSKFDEVEVRIRQNLDKDLVTFSYI